MSVMDTNLEDLACFVQVVDSGGFTAAGRVRARSTKQISRQVARLEDQLGGRLLTRTTRAVGLTDLGRRFYPHAIAILAELERAGAVLAGRDALVGELRVCLPTLIAVAGLGSALRALRAAHPALSLQITLTDQPLDLVAEGLDLQVMAARPTQTTMVLRRMRTLALPLAAHQSYLAARGAPERPEDLAHHECLLFVSDLPQVTWSVVDAAGRSVSVPVSGALKSGSSGVLFAALREGLGIGICGAAYLAGDGARDGLVRVLDGWTFEPLPLYAVFPRSNRSSALIAPFLDALTTALETWL